MTLARGGVGLVTGQRASLDFRLSLKNSKAPAARSLVAQFFQLLTNGFEYRFALLRIGLKRVHIIARRVEIELDDLAVGSRGSRFHFQAAAGTALHFFRKRGQRGGVQACGLDRPIVLNLHTESRLIQCLRRATAIR